MGVSFPLPRFLSIKDMNSYLGQTVVAVADIRKNIRGVSLENCAQCYEPKPSKTRKFILKWKEKSSLKFCDDCYKTRMSQINQDNYPDTPEKFIKYGAKTN